MLNQGQYEAVHAPPEEHLLIVAGAGTGKTKTLTHRIAHLITMGSPARTICAITFTNKAARELEDRLWSLLGPSEKGIGFVGTFHSLGARILRREAHLTGRTPDFVIFDDHDSLSLLKKVLKNTGGSQKKRPAQVRAAISRVKSSDPRAIPESALDHSLQEIFEDYEKELMRHNAFDFDDLLQKTVDVFAARPDVCALYRQKFAHILVDEYQDVNDIQHALLTFLAGPHTSLSAVGDAEQTIYSFRGSNIRIFLDFPVHWKNPRMVTLAQNYRSTKTILAAASSLISKNRYDTTVSRATALHTENEEGGPIVAYAAENENDEARWISEQIANGKSQMANNSKHSFSPIEIPELRKTTQVGFKNNDSRFAPCDTLSTAILYRTNAQSRAIEQALIGNNIPYRIYGGVKFYERKEVKDVVAALRLALNPHDTLSQERLEKGITKRRFVRYAEALESAPRVPKDTIAFFLNHTHYFEYLDVAFLNASERRENIEELVRFAKEFDSLPLFLERVSLLQSTDDHNGSTARTIRKNQLLVRENLRHEVQLMTIHIAKGLEFDRVFIAGCTEGILPHTRSMQSEAELQEERRLMYVAMTRAKKSCAISFYDIPSRFLGEISKEYIELESGTSRNKREFLDGDYEEQWIELE